MRIETKIILSNVFNIGLILLIGVFAMQDLNLVLTKLRFVEIADDLNASFLEMRISEKNYFLYHDEAALSDIREKIDVTERTIATERRDIIRAVGTNNFGSLESYLKSYAKVLEQVRRKAPGDAGLETKFRTEGRKLREFSSDIARMERRSVNTIISGTKNTLLYSFLGILLTAILVSHFISQKILRSLRAIEGLAKSISQGDFNRLESAAPRDEIGSVIAAINSMSEELRHREEELIQSKKLASLGILTAGVAHELTNPLNNISMIAQTYAEVYDKLGDGEKREFMDKVEGETERIRKIVKNLLDFSRPKDTHPKKADINEIIKKALNLVGNMLDIANIEVKARMHDGIPHVFVDEHQIQQVLVNLITNAVQAMPKGGVLFISTRQQPDRNSVQITVMDTGKGIPPEFLPHIFDPFFSTKGEGGTGLGLSVSYGIIKNHGGAIRVESKVDVGTTFTIELPVYKTVQAVQTAQTV